MNKQKLRELAEKATPGPWGDSGGYAGVISGIQFVAQAYGEKRIEAICNADFIAAANPATVIALLDENALLLEALKEVRKWLDDMGFAVDNIIAKYSEAAS